MTPFQQIRRGLCANMLWIALALSLQSCQRRLPIVIDDPIEQAPGAVGSGGAPAPRAAAAGMAAPRSPVAAGTPLGGKPATGAASASLDGVWVATRDPAQLMRFPEGSTNPVDIFALDENPANVEIVDGVAFYTGSALASAELRFVDLKSGAKGELKFAARTTTGGMVYADGSLWIADQADKAMWRVNPATKEIVGGVAFKLYDGDLDDGITLGASDSDIYATSLFGADDLARVGIVSGKVEAMGRGGDGYAGVSFGAGSVWAASRFDGQVLRIHPSSLAIEQKIATNADLTRQVRTIGVAKGAVWVVAGSGGDLKQKAAMPGVFRIDPATNTVVTRVPLQEPTGLRIIGDQVWVGTTAAAVLIDAASNSVSRMLVPKSGKVFEIAFARQGGGTGSTAGKPKIDVYSVVKPPPMICKGLTIGGTNPKKPLYGSGMATVTVAGTTTSLGFGTCMTRRDTTGKVVAYEARFVDKTPYPTQTASLSIKNINGDGTYSGYLSTTNAGYNVNATISQAGVRGSAMSMTASDNVRFDFDCGPGSALDVQPGSAFSTLMPGPNQVVLHDKTGLVYRFENVACNKTVLGDKLEIVSPEGLSGGQDYHFGLTTDDAAEAGMHRAKLGFTFYGFDVDETSVDITLICGDAAAVTTKGTFTSTDKSIEGSFDCGR